jgi:preprotein translocase subunit SecE
MSRESMVQIFGVVVAAATVFVTILAVIHLLN